MDILVNCLKAFLVGGAICVLVQLVMDHTKLIPARIMVMVVCLGTVLGFFNLYEPVMDFAGAGAGVPLLGFGNVLITGVKEAIDKEGFIGIFKGGFTSGALGICAALVFGYLASLVAKPKLK